MDFQPYVDESAVLELGGLTLENHLDHIALYGRINFSKDRQGLADALDLQARLVQIIAALQADELPERISVAPQVVVKNPFN